MGNNMTIARILIVEDEPVTAEDLHYILTSAGYAVTGIAVTGREAVDCAARDEPDLIIMDIRLKGKIDGIEATNLIHNTHQIPVIYLTAYADRDTLDRAKITLPYGYILKPFEKSMIKAAVEMALYRHETEQKSRSEEESSGERFEKLQSLVRDYITKASV